MWALCAVGFKWGVPCLSGGGGMGASVGDEFILFSPSFFLCGFLLLFTFLPLYIFFHLSGAWSTEKGWFPKGGGPQIGDGDTALGGQGIGKDGSGSGRFRGRGYLWASEGSNVTFLHIPNPTSSQEDLPHPICHYLPSAPSGVHRT